MSHRTIGHKSFNGFSSSGSGSWLVTYPNPPLKKDAQWESKWESFPPKEFSGWKYQKCLSCHHLAVFYWILCNPQKLKRLVLGWVREGSPKKSHPNGTPLDVFQTAEFTSENNESTRTIMCSKQPADFPTQVVWLQKISNRSIPQTPQTHPKWKGFPL